MIADQRLDQILQIASKTEFVEVDDLANRLNVSQMTIRRDLQRLSELGLMQRRHGGAVISSSIREEKDYVTKKALNLGSKKRLATAALSFINDNDILYLDGGTTTFELASLLDSAQHLTVITNDISAAKELLSKDISTIMVGGALQKSTQTSMGSTAAEFLKQFSVTTAFIGTTAVGHNFDVMCPTIEKAILKRTAMQIAQKSILLADNSKFFGYSLNRFANLSDFSTTITDKSFLEADMKRLEACFINIVQV